MCHGLQDNDQQLESASSIDGGTETSDDGTSGSVERATPCSNVTRSSSAGAAASDKVSIACHCCCVFEGQNISSFNLVLGCCVVLNVIIKLILVKFSTGV